MRYIHAALALAVLCLTLGGAAAQSSRQHLDAVAKASQALDQGRTAEALQAAEAALKLGLDGDLASRAFLIRAQAHEKSGRPAQAFADYNKAIWLQSLPAPERKKAVDGLARVRAALGLGGGGSETASVATTAPSSGGGGVGNFFENIFGGSSSAQQAQPATQPAPAAPQAAPQGWGARVTEAPSGAQPQPQRPANRPPPANAQQAAPARTSPPGSAPAPAPAASPQATGRQQQAAVQPPAQPQAPRAEPQSQPAAAPAAGGFNIVFGALSSERAAKAQAQQIKAQLSDILVNRELETVEDGMLFKIVAGPYRAKSAADALCRTIKERGVDCQVTR